MTDLTLGAARAAYYEANGFGADGGDSLEWVPLKIWKLTVKIPNSDGRRRAVRIHDLHHVVTGYATTLAGEAEIGAWELASGCLRFPAATVLNLAACTIGVAIAPRRCVRAWARGRATRNLYSEDGVEHLLPRSVDDTRSALGLDRAAPKIRVRDVLAVTAITIPLLLLPLAVIATVIALV